MQSYPIGKTNFAARVVSASVANVATFATLKVATASFGINFPGPSGSSGSTYTFYGPTGQQGPAGPQGPQGFGVYLLSSTRVTCSYAFSLGYSSTGTAQDSCVATPSTFYGSDGTLNAGDTIYNNTSRTIPAYSGYYSNGTLAWFNDGGGVLTNETACEGGGGGSPPGGGGGCSGTCFDGVGCTEGCYCSSNEGAGTCSESPPV